MVHLYPHRHSHPQDRVLQFDLGILKAPEAA